MTPGRKGLLVPEDRVEHVEIASGSASSETLRMGEELLFPLRRLVRPVGYEDHGTGVKPLVLDRLGAVPTLDTQTTIGIKRRWRVLRSN
jgi:hypothetical protein